MMCGKFGDHIWTEGAGRIHRSPSIDDSEEMCGKKHEANCTWSERGGAMFFDSKEENCQRQSGGDETFDQDALPGRNTGSQ